MEALILLAAAYYSKVEKGPVVAISLAMVVAMTEAVYHSEFFSWVVNNIGFHVYLSFVMLLMMVLIKGIKAKVAFVVLLLCFTGLIVNLLSFWIDALGYDSTLFFEVGMYSVFSLEVLAILRKEFTDGILGVASRLSFVRGYFRDFMDDNRGKRVQ